MTTLITDTKVTVRRAVDAVMADFGIPAEFLVTDRGNRYGVPWTRYSIDLPDGSCLRAWDDDTDVVVQQLTHAEGYEMNRVRLTNVPQPVVVALLSSYVTAALADALGG